MRNKYKENMFSIITPTYNRVHTLQRAYESLKVQTYKNFEWIIGDDGSTDETEILINNLKNKAYFPIIYFKFEHRGKAETIREIYYKTDGDYIFSLDSDDELYNEKVLENMNEKINSLDINKNFWGICGCYIDQYDNLISKFDSHYIDITKDNYFDMWIKNPSILNIKWIHKKGYFKLYDHSNVKDNLPYYPEVIDYMRNVAESEDYCYRLFNEPFYRYHTYNEDSVTVNGVKTPVFWYECVEMINLFYKHKLEKKYKKFLNTKFDILATKLYKLKGFFNTVKSLNHTNSKIKFILKFFKLNILKFFFLLIIDKERTTFFILGLKISIKNQIRSSI